MEFKKVPSLAGLYEISDTGILRNASTGKIIKGYTEKNGYQRVKIENKALGRVIRTTIHRLVAETFLPNPNNKTQVNHKDLNKQNNAVSSLEWTTGSENMKHAYQHGIGVAELAECRERHKRKVENGSQEFESISAAAEWLAYTGRCQNKRSGIAGISSVINGKRKTFGGFKWSVTQ